jgi:hypothetical protein
VSTVTPARGEDNPGLGDENLESGNCNLELGNRNPDSGNSNPGKENDRQGEEPVPMDVNMVFMIRAELCAPTENITELALGAEHAMFEKPKNPGAHMKPLFIRGHLDRTSIGQMSLMELQVSTSCHCHCSRSLTMSKVILNVQILALAVLQGIRWRQKE